MTVVGMSPPLPALPHQKRRNSLCLPSWKAALPRCERRLAPVRVSAVLLRAKAMRHLHTVRKYVKTSSKPYLKGSSKT